MENNLMSFVRKALVATFFFLLFFIASSAEEKQENPYNAVPVKNVVTAVTMADVEVGSQRVEKSVSWKIKMLSPTDLEQRKENLQNELCRETGADFLVDPQFSYEKKILGGGKLTLSGYPAKYVNFRNMTEEEIKAFILNPESQVGKVIFINQKN